MNGYVMAIDEVFPTQAEIIEELVESGLQKVERERAKLLRPDGSPMFAPAEHADRVTAIEEEAAASFDRSTERFLTLAEEERAKAEAALARLDGADGWERLSESERQAAATRREFIKEDARSEEHT